MDLEQSRRYYNMCAYAKLACQEYANIKRHELFLLKHKMILGALAVQIPENDMPAYVELTQELDKEFDLKEQAQLAKRKP